MDPNKSKENLNLPDEECDRDVPNEPSFGATAGPSGVTAHHSVETMNIDDPTQEEECDRDISDESIAGPSSWSAHSSTMDMDDPMEGLSDTNISSGVIPKILQPRIVRTIFHRGTKAVPIPRKFTMKNIPPIKEAVSTEHNVLYNAAMEKLKQEVFGAPSPPRSEIDLLLEHDPVKASQLQFLIIADKFRKEEGPMQSEVVKRNPKRLREIGSDEENLEGNAPKRFKDDSFDSHSENLNLPDEECHRDVPNEPSFGASDGPSGVTAHHSVETMNIDDPTQAHPQHFRETPSPTVAAPRPYSKFDRRPLYRMERAPLNQAHFHGRKADNHLKYLRFDEAIVSHQKAADCLQEVIETTTISSALQSLRLQRDYHLKRKDYSKMKKQQYACHALSAQMQETIQGQLFHELSKEQMKTCRELQMCIFTTMESADNLLETLYQRNEFAGGIVPRFDSYITTEQASGELSENAQQQHIDAMNVKHAEDCKVIDALRDTNHHLHRMVYRIVERLDENVQQGDALRKEIDTLKKLNAELQAPQNVNPVDGDVGGDAGNDGADGDREEAADAAVEVMQQDDNDIRDDELMMMIVESNPDNLEEEGAPEGGLPLLAPLELPTFNYDTLGGSDSDTA